MTLEQATLPSMKKAKGTLPKVLVTDLEEEKETIDDQKIN